MNRQSAVRWSICIGSWLTACSSGGEASLAGIVPEEAMLLLSSGADTTGMDPYQAVAIQSPQRAANPPELSCLQDPTAGVMNVTAREHGSYHSIDLGCTEGETLVNPFPIAAMVVSPLVTGFRHRDLYSDEEDYLKTCGPAADPPPTAASACNNIITLQATIGNQTWKVSLSHIQGSRLEIGAVVPPFAAIATCGQVGWANGPHVHMSLFNVTTGSWTYPGAVLREQCPAAQNGDVCVDGTTCCQDGRFVAAGQQGFGCSGVGEVCNGASGCLRTSARGCIAGDGTYCGKSVGRVPETLYACTGGLYSEVAPCPHGCRVAPAGSMDFCEVDVRVRADAVKAAAAARGITNALLIAGVGYHESGGLRHCWHEAPWFCPGPVTSDYGYADCNSGPVIAGSYDGACEDGGLGMFQFDSGTWASTLAARGSAIVTVDGNVAAAVDLVLSKLWYSAHTPRFAGEVEEIAWINSATPGSDAYETWLTAIACGYNGCCPGDATCSHEGVRDAYDEATRFLLTALGPDYWSVSRQPACPDPPCCGDGPLPTRWTWPVPAVQTVLKAFGVPVNYQSCTFHTGTDIAAAETDRIVAMGDGRVVYVGPLWLSGAGVGRGPQAIVIQHAPSFYSTYSHNDAAYVQAGDCVTGGQEIAEIGTLGYSGGPHLHWEVVSGTPFTGDWQAPFADACSHYLDPVGFTGSGGCTDCVCPAGNGSYCGGPYGRDANTLYTCTNGNWSVREVCTAGCQINPPGTPDTCKAPPSNFCTGKSNGWYCDGADLVTCSGGNVVGRQTCQYGCQINPPGTPDTCR